MLYQFDIFLVFCEKYMTYMELQACRLKIQENSD